jgi:hypothetical protein
MNIDQFFQSLSEHLETKRSKKRSVEVGKVPPAIAMEYIKHLKEKEKFMERVELEKGRLLLEVSEKLSETFDSRAEYIQERHNQIWSMIYEHLNLDSDLDYSFEVKQGKVYMEIDEERENVNPYNF